LFVESFFRISSSERLVERCRSSSGALVKASRKQTAG
jgi:hypothetical protein